MNYIIYSDSLTDFGDKLHFESVFWLDFVEAEVDVFYTIINDNSESIVRNAHNCVKRVDSFF